MTKQEIEKLSKELAKAVLAEWAKNPDLSYNEILEQFLVPYNDKIRDGILEEINNQAKSAVALGGAAAALPFQKIELELSPRLYNNAQNTAKAAQDLINQYNSTKSTLGELSTALYDGYDYGEVLDIKRDLPGFLQQQITQAKVDRLKTKALKAAYMDVLNAKNDKAYAKAIEVLMEEKSRYYGLRIAVTEQQKAFNLAQVAELLKDKVKYVKVTLSLAHKIPCVCDEYANRNTGFGAGVYPLMSAPMPPYHPFCKCVLVPVKAKWRPVKYQEPIIQNRWKTPVVGDVI